MSDDDTTRARSIDLGRTLAALRKGLITGAQLQAALRAKAGGSLIEALQQAGALDARKLAALLGASVLTGPEDALRPLIEAEIGRPAVTESYGIGDSIDGRYRILDIKQGGLGRVYICEQIGMSYDRGHSLCALKTPLKHHLANRDAADLDPLDQFRGEAANWVSLPPHPNIVLAYGVEEHGRLPYIVMEYIEGAVTLADEIIEGRTTWREALRIGLGMARGLAHAQSAAGLSHGDLKPLNILLTHAGAAKVTDFGFSVSLQTGRGVEDGWIVGTPGFVAPEMYLGRTVPTESADIYAFGVMLFQAATRYSPLPADPPGLNTQVDAPDPRSRAADVPPALATLINQCLMRDPNKRPRTFAEIVRRLEAAHRELLGTEPVADVQPDLPSPAEALRNAAQSWLNIGELNKADIAATNAIKADASSWRAHNALGLVQLEARDYRGALASFERAHECELDHVVPIANAVQASFGLRDMTRVDLWLELAVKTCSDQHDFAPLDVISNVVIERLTPDQALRFCHRIVEDNAEAVLTWNNLAILLRRQGRFEEAVASAQHAIDINPAYAKAWTSMANALLQSGRIPESLEAAETAIHLDPTLTGPYLAKASALAQLGQFADARSCIAHALVLKPGDPQLLKARDLFARAP